MTTETWTLPWRAVTSDKNMRRFPSFCLKPALVGLVLSLFFSNAGCKNEGCLASTLSEACEVVSPCEQLSFSCADQAVSVRVLRAGDIRTSGQAALASPGDYVLENSLVRAVVDDLAHPHYLAPTGGALLDLAPRSTNRDSLNHVFQATGLLPQDAANYRMAQVIDDIKKKAVQFRGTLDGFPNVLISTRYEIRPCEPGIRVRTEIVNRSADTQIWSATDGFYWGGRENLAFVPAVGVGFMHPRLTITSVNDVFVEAPYLVAARHTHEQSSYVSVGCNEPLLSGFHSDSVSSMGLRRRIIPPRDYEVFERFIGVADDGDVGPAADIALEVRRQLFDEAYVTMSGTIVVAGDETLGDPTRATILISEGTSMTSSARRTPWTQVTPDVGGHFQARVPVNKTYVVEVQTFGRTVEVRQVDVKKVNLNIGTLNIPPSAALTLSATLDGALRETLIFVHPADDATLASVKARLLGRFNECAPLLGAPHGGSPACNRVLTKEPTTVAVPPGSYDVYAVAGPFSSMAHQSVQLAPGDLQTLQLALSTLPIQPTSTLSADFHVHGAPSFDSAIPDADRVRAFLAAGIQVIAATEHDLVYDYATALTALGATNELVLIPGIETTGHVLFDLVPDTSIPKVIGHWIFWPLDYDPDGPYRGAPWDELVEPGALFTRMHDAGWPADIGIAQLNHPWAPLEFGRDLGFPKAIGLDLTEPLPTPGDKKGPNLLMRRPPGARFANSDYHAQEVMNGSDNGHFLAYRAYWFYLLNHGVLRTGTANSDSHGLTDNVLGTPRNLVWTTSTAATFDLTEFNTQVRRGEIVGTNGPVIVATMQNALGQPQRPSLEPIATSNPVLSLEIRAAPWVPVDEIRIIINGKVARILRDELAHPTNPLGTSSLVRWNGEIDLGNLLPAGDAWVVVEAGRSLEPQADLDCNGVPDTGDNNQDGVINWRDVDRNDDGFVDSRDLDLNKDGEIDDSPKRCDTLVGPLRERPAPTDRTDPLYYFVAVTPGSYPLAFTNPFVLERDGKEGFLP